MMRARISLTALTLTSSLTSFVAYTLMLKYLGISERMDILFYAASVPMSLAGMMSGALLYLLPSRFAQVSRRIQEGTWRTLSWFAVAVVIIVIAGAIIYGVLLERYFFITLWIGFALVATLLLVSTLLLCIAQARGAYMATGIAPLIASAGLLAGVFTAIVSRVEWLLLVGQLLGTATSVWWLARSLVFSTGKALKRDVLFASAVLLPLKSHAVAITMGTTAFTLFQPIDAALCAQLGDGSVSLMSYSQRIVVAVGTAVSLGAYAIAARTARDSLREGGKMALLRLANIEILRVVGFGMVVWLGYLLGGSRVLAALLGSAMLANSDLSRLLEVVQWMLLGVGPMAAMPYLFRVFYSLEAYRKPALLGICIPPTYGFLAWLTLAQFDILALAYAYTLVWWAALVIALLWLNLPTTKLAYPIQT